MASIQSLGIGSGLLTSELVDDIIAAEREPIENRLDAEQELVEAKISAYGEIVSSVSAFDSSLQALSLPSTFNTSQAESTNEALVSATASSVAVAGSYTVEVSQLAQSHSVASDAYATLDEIVGTGSLTFKFGTIAYDMSENYQSFTVNPDTSTETLAIDSTNNTLAGIRDAVNNADFGVLASIVDDGSGFRLVFSAEESGLDQALEIVATGDAGIRALNYNLASETATLNAVTAAGTTDLSTGAGLSAADRAFTIDYNGTALNVLISSDPAIDTTGEVVTAVQAALDAALIAQSFSAGDVIASGSGDRLSFSTLANGFATTLEVTNDGSAPVYTGGGAISDGFDFSANNATFSIAIDGGAANAITLNTASANRQGTIDLINAALATAGIDSDVTASLGGGNELVFTRSLDGASRSVAISAIDVSGTAASSELGLTVGTVNGLDGFGLDTGEGEVTGSARLSETIRGQDANLTVNGLDVTRGSNLVAGVISGTTLNLKSVTTGPVTITVAKDPDALVDRVQEFVDAYNELKLLSAELTAFDTQAGQGSILIGDSTLRTVTAGISALLRSTVTGLTGSVRSLAEVGITTDQNNSFQLSFDSVLFRSEFEQNPTTIEALFANAGSTTDAQIDYVSAGTDTQPGTYDIEIDALATVGQYTGHTTASLGAGNIAIDDDNDQFTISLNGLTADITLTQATYATADDLALELQQQINSDSGYQDGGHSVTVSFNSGANRFDFASNIFGSISEVLFTATDSDVANELGLLQIDQGPFQTNQLASLSTPNGNSNENFDAAVTLDADTSFELSIGGVSTGLLTVPGSVASPVTYNQPDDLIAAMVAEIDSDGSFAAQPARSIVGEVLTAGMDFSAANRSMTFSYNGGSDVVVNVTGDASTVSFGGQTIGTLANSLAAIQDAIDGSALNGLVTAEMDGNDRIRFSTAATGATTTLEVVGDGIGASTTGSTALTGAGFDFASSNATFDIAVDNNTAVSVTIDTATADRDETVQEVQNALNAAGVGTEITASLSASDELVLTRTDRGATTAITISSANATAIAELGLANGSNNGLNGFNVSEAEFSGVDQKNYTIDYSYDSGSALGRFVFSSDDHADVIQFDNVSSNAATTLGIFIGDGTVSTSVAGTDVVGKINGVAATGAGQLLRGATGNVPAKPGFYLNTAVGNLAASTTSDTFRVTVDGITSTAITLGTINNPDPVAVAVAMETAINSDPNLLNAGVSIDVDYDLVSGGFGIISRTVGPTSNVSLSSITGNAGSIFGFAPGIGSNGAVGSAAQGSPDPSSNLRVRVIGGSTGARGSVSFVRGVADQLNGLLDSFLASDGLLSNRQTALDDELTDIGEERVALDARLQLSEERLRASFLANDLIISNLNSTADFLSSQLTLLEGLLSSNREDN